MTRALPALGLVLLAAACSKPVSQGGTSSGSAAPAGKAGARAGFVAYSYAATIAAHGARLTAVERTQEAACDAAGAAVCQTMTSQMSTGSGGAVAGELDLRAKPDWLAGFRSRLDADARAAGGRISQRSVSGEDETADVVGAQAKMRAQTALRDRLQALLDAKPANVHDLLDIEKELAQAQGDLDAAQAQASALSAQTGMVAMKLTYDDTRAAASNAWSMVGAAVTGGEVTIATSLAVLITLGMALAPWIVIGLVIWFVVRRIRRNRPRAAPRPLEPPPRA